MEHYTKAQIRRFLVSYHGLDTLDAFGTNKEGILNFFEHITSIQNDPLNVVGKNAELVLHARFNGDVRGMLYDLLYNDKKLVDGFDKESSIHLMKEWKKYTYVKDALATMDLKVLENRGYHDALDAMEDIYNQFIPGSEFTSKDFNAGSGAKHSWWSTSYANCILHHLWCRDKIGISSRKKTVRLFARIEDVVPMEILNEPTLSFDEFFEWYVLRRIKQQGLYWLKKGAGWQGFYMRDMKKVQQVVNQAVADGRLTEIMIEDIHRPFYIHTQDYHRMLEIIDTPLEKPQLRFIAPLDNFIWDRPLIKLLFDFEYSWEVYVPKDKRKYGYYVLPILYGDTFIGRVEPNQNKAKAFIIENLWFEDKKYETKKMMKLIESEIKRHNRNFHVQ